MVIREPTTINNKQLIKNYSDEGYLIERDGILYEEAIDPVEYADARHYIETKEKGELHL